MDADQEEFYVSPIAEPMASEKLNLKILKLTRSCKLIFYLPLTNLTNHVNPFILFLVLAEKLVKRGVKEVVKALRKDFNG